jgi:hypothetical protein
VRKDRKIDDSQSYVVIRDERLRRDEILSDTRREFQNPQGLPPQLAHGALGFTAAGESPRVGKTIAGGIAVSRGGYAQGVGVGNGFTQELH